MYHEQWCSFKYIFIIFWMCCVCPDICHCQSYIPGTGMVPYNNNFPPNYNSYGVQYPQTPYYYPSYYGYYDQPDYQLWLNSYIEWLQMRTHYNLHAQKYPEIVITKPVEEQIKNPGYDRLLSKTLDRYDDVLKKYFTYIKHLHKFTKKQEKSLINGLDSTVSPVTPIKDELLLSTEYPNIVKQEKSNKGKTSFDEHDILDIISVSKKSTTVDNQDTTKYFTKLWHEDEEQTYVTECNGGDCETVTGNLEKSTSRYKKNDLDEFITTKSTVEDSNEDERSKDYVTVCDDENCVNVTKQLEESTKNPSIDLYSGSTRSDYLNVTSSNTISTTIHSDEDLYLEQSGTSTGDNKGDYLTTMESYTDAETSSQSCHKKDDVCNLQEPNDKKLQGDEYLKYLHTTVGEFETTTEFCDVEVMATTDLDTDVLHCKDCTELNEIRGMVKRLKLIGLSFLDMGHLLLNEDTKYPIVPKFEQYKKIGSG